MKARDNYRVAGVQGELNALLSRFGSRIDALERMTGISVQGAIQDVEESDITLPNDGPGDADTLRDDLVFHTIPDIRDGLRALEVKVNTLLSALRAAGVVKR
jgi:hypothetical protein